MIEITTIGWLIWLGSGLPAGVWAARRWQDVRWVALGAVLGPFVLLSIALYEQRERQLERTARPVAIHHQPAIGRRAS